MLSTATFSYQNDPMGAIREMITQVYDVNGFAPGEVWVHAHTQKEIGETKVVIINLGGQVRHIPIEVRSDLKVGFRLNHNEFILTVNDPNSVLE